VGHFTGAAPTACPGLAGDGTQNPKARDRDRIAAYRELFDRGWGKAPAFAAIEGADPPEQDEVAEAIEGLVAQLRDTTAG
jgi:hypothetical protein